MPVIDQPAPPTSDSISQSEIERLLSQIGAGDAPVGEAEVQETGRVADSLARHAFPQLSFFSPVELRKLRLRHEELIRYVGAQLASYLRLESVLQLSRLETMSFQKFIDSLCDPTHLTLFKLAPLQGTCLLDIPPRLGLCLVDRQLGGPAVKVDTSRSLSEIEVRLISRVAELILSEWCSYWNSVTELRASIVGHEGNGRFVQTSSPNTMMLVLGITAWLGGEIMDEMQLAFPYYTMEPLLTKLASQNQEQAGGPEAQTSLKWNPLLAEIDVPVSVEFPSIRLSTSDLAKLKPGDFIPLRADAPGRMVVRVCGQHKFTGELGCVEGQRAVRITSALKTPKRS